MPLSPKWQTALAIALKVAEAADFLGLPYAGTAEKVIEIAPGIIDDIEDAVVLTKDAITRIETMFGGGGDSVMVAALSPEHVAAVEAVHERFTTYIKSGRNPIDAISLGR